MVVLRNGGAGHAGHGAGSRDVTRQLADIAGIDVANPRCHLGRVLRVEAIPEQLEDRRNPDNALQRLHLILPFEGREELPQPQLPLRGLRRPLRAFVEHVEHVVPAATPYVGFTQEPAGIGANQQGQVRLLADERRVVQTFGDHNLCHAESESRVRARPHRYPAVCMDGGGVVVRADGDDARAVIACLGKEVEIGNLRVSRVSAPDKDHVGVEVVVSRTAGDRCAERDGGALLLVADLGVEVKRDGAEEMREAVNRRRCRNARGVTIEDDRLRAVPHDHIKDTVRDIGERLVPADLLP